VEGRAEVRKVQEASREACAHRATAAGVGIRGGYMEGCRWQGWGLGLQYVRCGGMRMVDRCCGGGNAMCEFSQTPATAVPPSQAGVGELDKTRLAGISTFLQPTMNSF